MKNVGSIMAEKLRQRIADYERDTNCGRSDLDLADFEPISTHEARIMLEYSRERGTPAPSEIGRWVLATTQGAAHVILATLKDHPELGAVTGIIRETQQPVPIKRSASMMYLGGGQYADTDRNMWKVQEGPGGEKFLVRASDVDLSKLLEERKNRQRSGRYARVDLSMVRTAGIANMGTGDTVLYAEPGGGALQKTGVIESVSGKNVKIKGREGSLDKSYVLDVVEQSAASKAAENKMLADFMSEWLFSGDKSLGNKMKIK